MGSQAIVQASKAVIVLEVNPSDTYIAVIVNKKEVSKEKETIINFSPPNKSIKTPAIIIEKIYNTENNASIKVTFETVTLLKRYWYTNIPKREKEAVKTV